MAKDLLVGEKERAAKASGKTERDAVLISMKRDKSKDKKSNDLTCCGPSDNDYPYGLNVSLEKESLEKLGLEALPKVGDKVKITADAVVERVSESASKDHKDRSASLQITAMKLG